jgi:hypothetical protein
MRIDDGDRFSVNQPQGFGAGKRIALIPPLRWGSKPNGNRERPGALFEVGVAAERPSPETSVLLLFRNGSTALSTPTPIDAPRQQSITPTRFPCGVKLHALAARISRFRMRV